MQRAKEAMTVGILVGTLGVGEWGGDVGGARGVSTGGDCGGYL